MAPLKPGDKFPSDIKFDWVPNDNLDPTSCGRPQEYDAGKEWKGKKVVLVSVPGAFTPGCQAKHLPPYIENLSKLKEKGVDIVAFIAYNDAFVMSAWGKVNKVEGDDILFLSDTKSHFAKNHAWLVAPNAERNGRWAMIIEKDGTVSYAEVETKPGVISGSGAEAVLSKL